ncbi:MAG: response regulator transcription factor [Terracidiphilus sp.]
MQGKRNPDPIRIGLVTDEPIRLEGLFSIFDESARDGGAHFIPLAGSLEKLLNHSELGCLIVDRSSSAGSLETLRATCRARPGLRQIVIGPIGNDEVVQQAIIAGARAYVDPTAGPEVLIKAVEEVMGGSIWAPRRVLSKLIDRLLSVPDRDNTDDNPHLTEREREVLDLLLLARSNREIAEQLGIEERTVKAHVGRLMRKTGVDNRIALSMLALNAPAGAELGAADRRQAEGRRGDRGAADGAVLQGERR